MTFWAGERMEVQRRRQARPLWAIEVWLRGDKRLGSDHWPLVCIFLLYRCKVSLTAVLNTGFLDEVSKGVQSIIPPDLDPRLNLIVPLSPHPKS